MGALSSSIEVLYTGVARAQDDEKTKKFEEQLRGQLADELDATKRENFEGSAVACRGHVDELYSAAVVDMGKVCTTLCLPCVPHPRMELCPRRVLEVAAAICRHLHHDAYTDSRARQRNNST